jgi:hypothetical protein
MDATVSPDPITQPKEYQEYLLAALGADDPADAQRSTPAALRALFTDGAGDLAAPPAPREWSALECAAHIFCAEIVASGRYRWILAHDEPPLIGYDQDLWVGRLPQDRAEPAAMLDTFDALRASNVRLWAGTVEADRARVGMHAERGPESFDLTFRLIAGHDRIHLSQARRALAAVRA